MQMFVNPTMNNLVLDESILGRYQVLESGWTWGEAFIGVTLTISIEDWKVGNHLISDLGNIDISHFSSNANNKKIKKNSNFTF